MDYKNITKIIPTAMAAGLAVDNMKFISKKDKGSKSFMKQGVKNIVGVSLIKSTAETI